VEGGSHDGRGMGTRSVCFFSGLAPGLLGMLSTIMRPMLAAMDGRDFRSIGPIVALVFLWDDPGSTSFVLTAIGSPRSAWVS
jgi:hypothetical protein